MNKESCLFEGPMYSKNIFKDQIPQRKLSLRMVGLKQVCEILYLGKISLYF